MQLDTNQLKGRIDSEVDRINGRIEALHKEIKDLESERARLGETFQAVEAVERIARELDLLDERSESVDSGAQVSQEPPRQPIEESRSVTPNPSAYAEESEDEKPVERIHDFKQWA